MFLQDFFESVDDDVNASIKARSAAFDIAKVLYANEFDFEIDDAGEEFLAVSGKHAGEGFEDVLFVFGNRKPGISGPSGGFGVLNPPVEGHNFVVVIYSGSPLQENQPKDYMSLNVIRIMSHELIHYFDYLRSHGKITKSYAGSDDREAYFNDPAEFNAFFNDLTAHISDFVHDARKDPDFANDLAELYGVDRSFETTLNNMISRSDRVTKAFVKNLNEPRRKALLKRLYRLHQEAVKLLPVSESVENVKFPKDHPMLQGRLAEDVSGDVIKQATEALADEIMSGSSSGALEGVLWDLGIDRDEVDFDLHQEQFRDWAENRVRNAYENIRWRIKGGVIRCWRVITASADWKPGMQPLGIYWSWDRDHAEAHWGDFHSGHVEIEIEADIPESSIDWLSTLKMNGHPDYENEREIRIFKGSPVKIIGWRKNG